MFQYGDLDYGRFGFDTYPLHAVRSPAWNIERPVVLITGGVHGYETIGFHGALDGIERGFADHAVTINVLLLPCVSPWGYETVNRWKPEALDPDRRFKQASQAAESAQAMACGAAHCARVDLHVDLHETTDTDASEFGPAKAARDSVAFDRHDIPDGFYLVGDVERPAPQFKHALIESFPG